jgi:DNA-binding NarL/FixJ family response regulator
MAGDPERSVKGGIGVSTRILLADDHAIMREGLKSLLVKQFGMSVVGECSDGNTAVRMARELEPDVVVMDISMPDLDGIEATRRITAVNKDVRVLALSQHSDMRMVTEMFRAGASGFLLKDAAFGELVRAVTTICEERTYISPDVAGGLVEKHVQRQAQRDDESALPLLSDREREVLQLLAEGNSTKEVAAKLMRSVKTIETHRHNIMQRLNLHSLPELTKYAVREGLTALDK